MNFELNNANLVERYWRLKEIIQPVIQKNINENFTLLIENGQLFAKIEGFFFFCMSCNSKTNCNPLYRKHVEKFEVYEAIY